jgi:hypothetical protein
MSTQTLIHRFFQIGGVVSLILLVLLAMFDPEKTTTINPNPGELSTLDENRLKIHKPGGIFGDLDGDILLRGGKIISEDTKGFVVKFTNSIDFSAQIWDPSVGKKDGDGIKNVQFKIFDENDIYKLVHERVEQDSSYCPFGGGEPTCRISQLAKNHKYRVEIRPEPKKPSDKKTLWFFHIQT